VGDSQEKEKENQKEMDPKRLSFFAWIRKRLRARRIELQ
jgi:hypothetical protein